MQDHRFLTDIDFENQFESSNLDPSIFSHEAHLRLAWIHIHKYGIQKALKTIPIQLQNYVEKLDAKDKYNETLTIAAIKAVYHFMLNSSSQNFEDFIVENPRLNHAFQSLINSHYSFDIFQNNQAKTDYLEPDLLPFDL